MRHGDGYKHFKGATYLFDRIALPLEDRKDVKSIGVARYHENTHDIKLYIADGVTFIDAEVPHAIYQAESDAGTETVWCREIDNFFGCKDGKKRFELMED